MIEKEGEQKNDLRKRAITGEKCGRRGKVSKFRKPGAGVTQKNTRLRSISIMQLETGELFASRASVAAQRERLITMITLSLSKFVGYAENTMPHCIANIRIYEHISNVSLLHYACHY